MATVKNFINAMLLVGIYTSFRYLGDFTAQQSAVLTIFAGLGYITYEHLNNLRRATDAFSPFCVSIQPNWHKLLFDFGLIRTEEEWHTLWEAVHKTPDGEYTALRDGLMFTAIKPPGEDNPLPGLIFWNHLKIFSTDVELSEPLIKVEGDLYSLVQRADKGERHPFFHHPLARVLPSVCLRRGLAGYEIGLEVDSSWWRRHSVENKEYQKIKEDHDSLYGPSRLAIATLPYSEFSLYYHNIDVNTAYDRAMKFLQKFEKARDRELEKNGWKRPQEEFEPEIPDPWSHLEHKYFMVLHRSI